MSHQTGATFFTELFQITELIKKFKQPRPAQTMYKEVPTFQASRCQYNGMAQSRKPMNENAEYV